MNLSIDPLVVRSRFRSLLPDEAEIAFQFNTNLITVFVKNPDFIKLIPETFDESVVRVICIIPDI
jgi:hypothetical protein